MQNLKKILKNLPKSFGIYQFFDKNGKIIYIGKSVNLLSRVNSYFNGKSKLNFAKKKMVDKICDIKTILVNNETESLILETNLIKEHKPKYNILMKDDKNHIYLKITDEDFPKIIKVRNKAPYPNLSPQGRKGQKVEFFGPYLNGYDVENVLRILKNIFGYGICQHNFFKSKNSYNLDKYLFEGNKKGISDEEKKKIYLEEIEKIRQFLKSDYKDIIKELNIEMLKCAKKLNFEKADTLKKQIESLNNLNEKQIVREGINGDYDIINYLEKFDNFFIGLTKIRESKILGYYSYEIENKLEENKQEILESFLEKRIVENMENPNPSSGESLIGRVKYIIPDKLIANPLPGALEELIEIPKIGTKLDLLKMTYKNIYEFAYKKHIASLSTKNFTKQTMKDLLFKLGLKRINKSILFECNDISHISGNHTVASRSIIENGKPNPSKYRKFRIKTLPDQKIDDFSSMKEIMTRRLKEIEKSGIIPDLIVIDGGKGQLSSVMKIINNFPKNDLIKNLQLVSIAKREEELFLPGESESIILDKDSQELRMIQKIRDEAHRFAITFNRDSRIKSMKKNILESLPGIGPKTRKKILKEFGSIDELKNKDRNDFEKILSKSHIEILENHGLL